MVNFLSNTQQFSLLLDTYNLATGKNAYPPLACCSSRKTRCILIRTALKLQLITPAGGVLIWGQIVFQSQKSLYLTGVHRLWGIEVKALY